MIDQVVNETLDVTDSAGRSVEIGVAMSDVLSVDVDVLALAMAYQYALADSVSYSDSVLVESHQGSFATDAVSAFDNVGTAFEYNRAIFEGLALFDQVASSLEAGRVASDSMGVADTISAGLIKDAFAQDTLSMTEALTNDSLYSRTSTDSFLTSDEVYPWVNGILQAALSGDSEFNAVAMIRNPPATPPAARSKTLILPRPQAEAQHSYVVNPTPPRKQG